jgi:hypothetical protein
MTINLKETIDKLDEYANGDEYQWAAEEAVTLLRQQEQKIASLEKDFFMLQKHYDQLSVRELTDVEIMQIWQDADWGNGEEEDILFFAKLLLKKASDK